MPVATDWPLYETEPLMVSRLLSEQPAVARKMVKNKRAKLLRFAARNDERQFIRFTANCGFLGQDKAKCDVRDLPVGPENEAVAGETGGVPGGAANAGRNEAHAAVGQPDKGSARVHCLQVAGIASGDIGPDLRRGRGRVEGGRGGRIIPNTHPRRMKLGRIVLITGGGIVWMPGPALVPDGAGGVALGVLLTENNRIGRAVRKTVAERAVSVPGHVWNGEDGFVPGIVGEAP